MDKLTIDGMIKDGIALGLKNLVALIVNGLLWILTVWIPYLNVGTTIGLFVGLVAKVSRGEEIGYTEIFDAKYRKRMGEFFLGLGLQASGIITGFLLFVIPGIVIAIAWGLTNLFVVDKEINPVEAISKSNTVTYGNKATIFFGYLVFFVITGLAITIVSAILGLISPVLSVLIGLVGIIFIQAFSIGIQAHVYKVLGEAV